MKKHLILALGSFLFLSQTVKAGLIFNYSQLALKDLEQMSKLIQTKIEEARKSGGNKVIPLKEGLQAVYSRSNEDFMIEKILSPLKNELEEHNAWEKSIQDLVKEAIGALKNPKAFQPTIQITYIIFLENMMAEMRPRIGQEFENKIVKKIRDAKIEVTKAADTERRLRVMKGASSPSDIANTILTEFEEAQALKEKQKEEQKKQEQEQEIQKRQQKQKESERNEPETQTEQESP